MYYDQKESGKRIAALRKEKGLTQEQLAEKLNISTSILDGWIPSNEQLWKTFS